MGTGKLLGKPDKLRGSDLWWTSIQSRGNKIHVAASWYRNQDTLRQLWGIRLQGFIGPSKGPYGIQMPLDVLYSYIVTRYCVRYCNLLQLETCGTAISSSPSPPWVERTSLPLPTPYESASVKPNHNNLGNASFAKIRSILETEEEFLMSSQRWLKFLRASLFLFSVQLFLFYWVLQTGHYLRLSNRNVLCNEIIFLIYLLYSGPYSL